MLIGAASAQAQAPVKVLVFHGPPDATTTAGVAALEELGADNDFDVDATADATQIAEDNLAGYRAVVFLNTAGDLLNAGQEGALQGFVEAGGGFLGIGSAAQGETSNSFFDGLIGARPTSTSSTATTEQTVTAGDRVHPSTRDMPLMMNRSDVWYQWQTRPTGTVHTVARYRAPNAPAGDGTSVGGTDHPISWCRDFRGGRSFYTGMGRIAAAYSEADFKDHLLGAIEWTAGLLRTNCKATLNSSYRGTRVLSGGPESTGLATSGESHGLTVAPNGWVIYIGRGDCRTDAERGSLLGGGPLARVFDHANVNVGIGCGSVHVFDPAQYTGQENSGVTLAGKLAVYGDGGQGGERTDQNDHKMEYGLLGVTTAPDFATTGHIYLQYFPTFNPATSPPGLPVERRISKMSRPRISRFTIDRTTKKLDLSSEVIVFEYDAQIYSCCHVGGGMGFDSDGDLYVTTGDTNSSQGTTATRATTRPLSAPPGRRPRPPGCTAAPRTTPTRTRAGPRATPTTTTARCCGSSRSRRSRTGRSHRSASARRTRCRPRRRPTARTCSTAPRAAAARPSPRSMPWACATRAGSRSTRRPTCRTRPGSARTRARRALPRARRRMRTPRRSRAPATMAGRTAWATSRPTATGSPTARSAPPTRPATSPAAPPAAAPTAGTTATTSSTTRPTTPG